jgi:hypothetical protein
MSDMSSISKKVLMAIAKEIPPNHEEFLASYDTTLARIGKFGEDRPYILVYYFLLSLQDQERSVSELRQSLMASARSATAIKYLGRG